MRMKRVVRSGWMICWIYAGKTPSIGPIGITTAPGWVFLLMTQMNFPAWIKSIIM